MTTLVGRRDEETHTFTDRDGVLFCLADPHQAKQLIVAVFQLREVLGFQHRIAIVTFDDACRRCVLSMIVDERFKVEAIHLPGKKRKADLIDITPFPDRTVALETCTIVTSCVDGNEFHLGQLMPPNAHTPEVILVQFGDRVTTDAVFGERMKNLSSLKGADLIAAMTAHPYPVVSPGVIGFSKHSWAFFDKLRSMAENNPETPQAALIQLIYAELPHRIMFDQYCSSVSCGTGEGDIVVHYGHDGGFLDTDRGKAVFEPVEKEARRVNFGNILDFD